MMDNLTHLFEIEKQKQKTFKRGLSNVYNTIFVCKAIYVLTQAQIARFNLFQKIFLKQF